mgnify:CR=1 FL=1
MFQFSSNHYHVEQTQKFQKMQKQKLTQIIKHKNMKIKTETEIQKH